MPAELDTPDMATTRPQIFFDEDLLAETMDTPVSDNTSRTHSPWPIDIRIVAQGKVWNQELTTAVETGVTGDMSDHWSGVLVRT